MSENINISSPVKVVSDSKEAVAFELMKHISSFEGKSEDEMSKREYWLTLYHQSIKAVRGQAPQ